MNPPTLQHIAGWSALINAFAEITSFIALMLFFALGGLWGPINDGLSVVWALSMIPLAWLFYHANGPVHPGVSTLAAFLGISSMLLFAALQFLLIVGVVHYEQTLSSILTLTGMIGVWLLINGLLARTGQALPQGLVWVMLAFGVGLILSSVGFWLGGEQHPLTAVGFIVGSLMGMVWAAWLAWWLMTGRLLQTA
jgi:hypothetical protein